MWDGRDCQGLSAKGKFLGDLVCLCAWAHCEDKGCLSGDRSKSPKVNLQIDQTSCCALIYLAVRWQLLHGTPQRFFTALKMTNGCTLLHTHTLKPLAWDAPWGASWIPYLAYRGCLYTGHQGIRGSRRNEVQGRTCMARHSLIWCRDMVGICVSELRSVPRSPANVAFAISEAENNQMREWITEIAEILLNKKHGTPCLLSWSRKYYLFVYLISASSFTPIFFGYRCLWLLTILCASLFKNLLVLSHSLRHASWVEVIQIIVLKTCSIYFEVNNILLSLGG